MTAPKFSARKGKQRLVCLTAYDVVTAQILDEAGVDLILVGDSLGNVVLGHETTLPVTLDQMVTYAAAVMRARPRALVIADMPYLTFHVSPEETVRNAGRLVQEGGVDGVKVEGGIERLPHIRHLLQAKIPVMGHLGLTPQSVLEFGGYRVQARTPDAAEALVTNAKALEDAGCFAVVLEGVPAPAADRVTAALSVPTIGIGAGPGCDGQILVVSDLLGLTSEAPRFVRRYADLRSVMSEAVRRYGDDVREGRFPGPEETYSE
jgi:3-methyl-2-oxobutanoate hydroxymethyltransferase